MRAIWDTHLKPYLFRRTCFRRRERLEDWLRTHHGVIQDCRVELGLVDPEDDCSQVKAQTYLYLDAFKKSGPDWQDRSLYFRPTATILDLQPFGCFDDYARAVSRSSRGNDNRAVKKALRLGYRTRIIDPGVHRSGIARIRRSKLVRTGGLVLEALRPHGGGALDVCERLIQAPACARHWSLCWGAFKEDELLAYVLLMRCGNIARTIHIMAHRDGLHDGALKLLLFDIIRSILEKDRAVFDGLRYLMYGALEHGAEGLCEWKKRLQFQPSLLDMRSVFDDVVPAGFDEIAYWRRNPDVKKAKLDARLHYAVWGRREGRRYR